MLLLEGFVDSELVAVGAAVGAAVHVGPLMLAKEPAVHATVLLPEYPVAEHVRVQAAPDATSELAQSEV